MDIKPRITVFTPTFNRAHTLPRTYESLKNQRDKRFVWLIVDDGSTDDTKQLVDRWMKENDSFANKIVWLFLGSCAMLKML